MLVIDGKDCVLGRIASIAAKEALRGESVAIVNAEKIVVLGDKKMVIAGYWKKRARRNIANPRHGPKLPIRPDLFVKKAVRGMLPIKTRRGAKAFRRIKAYVGVPEEFMEKGSKFYEKKDVKSVSVAEICKSIGGWS